jgi:phage virion morphogenesis protein
MGLAAMITIDIQDAALLAALQKLSSQLQDLSQPMFDVGQALESAVRERFVSMSDPSGEAWAKLSDSTLAQRAKNGKAGGNILFEEGVLLKSLGWASDAKTAQVGFGQAYAAYHEWGTKRMPRRGLLMDNPDAGTLGKDDLEKVLDVLREHLQT